MVLVVRTKMNSSSDITELFNVSALIDRALASGITAIPCLFILVLSLVAQGFTHLSIQDHLPSSSLLFTQQLQSEFCNDARFYPKLTEI